MIKTIFLVFLVSCSSPQTRQSHINSCISLSESFYKYKYEPLINCNNLCIQNKVAIFSKRLNIFLNPYLIKAQNLDKKNIIEKQLGSIKNSSSSDFCGNLNKSIKKIFSENTNQKFTALSNLININATKYYHTLSKSKKITTKRPNKPSKAKNNTIRKDNANTKKVNSQQLHTNTKKIITQKVTTKKEQISNERPNKLIQHNVKNNTIRKGKTDTKKVNSQQLNTKKTIIQKVTTKKDQISNKRSNTNNTNNTKNNKMISNVKKVKLRQNNKNNLQAIEKCKEPLQDLRFHILTKGKNNKLYKIYNHMYNKCLDIYMKKEK